MIVTSFGDPYVMYYFPALPTYLNIYDESIQSQKAAVRGWLGEISVTGRSPVTLERYFKRGDGIKIG